MAVAMALISLLADPHARSKWLTCVLWRVAAAVVLRQCIGSVVFLCRGDGLLGRREGLSCDSSMIVGACQCVWGLNEHASLEWALWG